MVRKPLSRTQLVHRAETGQTKLAQFIAEMSTEPKFYEKYPVYEQFWYRGQLFSGLKISIDHLKEIPDLQVRDTDILICSFPKCGSHWVGHIVTMLANENDIDEVAGVKATLRAPFLQDAKSNETFEKTLQDASPRIYCCHLAPEMLPQAFKSRGRIISLYRNPKDVAVSYFFFYKMYKRMNWYKGSWSEFLKAFMDGEVEYGSYFEYLSKWWRRENQENIHYVPYESLSGDLAGEIRKLCDFLGFSLREESLEKVFKYASFQHMRQNPGTNRKSDVENGNFDYQNSGCEFLRKGKVNDWKNTFTVRDNEVFEEHIKEQEHKFGVNFPRD